MQIYNIGINENKMETTSHGTADFPIAIYETVLNRNILGFVDWHWHNELQFCYITSGSVRFTINSFSHDLGIDEGIFINSGVLHMAKPLTEDASYICIDASPALISSFEKSAVEKKYVEPFINDSAFTFSVFNASSDIIENLNTIYRLNKERTFAYEAEITARLILCWKEIIGMKNNPLYFDENYLRLKHLLTYIHNHYKDKLTLENISNEIHLCPSECCRFFKKHMDCTIFEYINNFRLSESTVVLLGSANMSVSQIAYEYGFGSTSYYIEKFRKKTGMTPLAYRKAHLK